MADLSLITLDLIREDKKPVDRKTKVVCTLGPACWSVENLSKLINAGMNVARFNFSHGDVAGHTGVLDRLREAMVQTGKTVAVLLDTKGPEIRTGFVDPSLGGKLRLMKDSIIEIGTDYDKKCTPEYLACSYPSLPKSVSVGSKILCADGAVTLEVTEIKETSVMARVLNNASFGDRKNMNLPGAYVDLPTCTDIDVTAIKEFAVKQKVDFIAASFVRKASDIDTIRELCGEEGKHIKIISKIENQEGLENYDAILERGDGIMVARGDLGMEIPIERVFLAQKDMIRKANIAGKPVVTATQMLESMITNPRPTRAECADVANAVLDGTDCVMLSGETANGEFFEEACSMMCRICLEAECMVDYDAIHTDLRTASLSRVDSLSFPESVAGAAVKIDFYLKDTFFVVITQTGYTARLVAKYRQSAKILAVTNEGNVKSQSIGYLKGVSDVMTSADLNPVQAPAAVQFAKDKGLCKDGDVAVVVRGSVELANTSGGSNLIHVMNI